MILHASVTSPASYATDPDVNLKGATNDAFPIEIHIANLNATATNTVTVSFDGTKDAFVLVPGARPWIKLTRCRAIQKIWVKGVGSAVCDITVFD